MRSIADVPTVRDVVRRAVAGCVLAAVVAAGLATALPGAASAASGPALATGTSQHPSATWRLEGDRLTVRFARPLLRRGRSASLRIYCGDLTVAPGYAGSYGAGLLADRATSRMRLRTGARVVRARLSRDTAASTTRCELHWQRGMADFGEEHATMRLRRGRPPGCRPGLREDTVLDGERVLVTVLWVPDEVESYRACVKPDGRQRPFLTASIGGGGGASSTILEPWAAGGTWVAWGSAVSPHDGTTGSFALKARDVAGRGPEVQFAVAPDGTPAGADVESLAVAADGTVAWALRVHEQPDQLNVRRPGGPVTTVATGPPSSLGDVAISADGATVTWNEAGVPRSAPLPAAAAPTEPRAGPPSAAASARDQPRAVAPEATAVAAGRSRDGRASFRLAGRELTVALDRRLAPRGTRGRVPVRIVCGDSVLDPAANGAFHGSVLAALAQSRLDAAPAARRLRTRLDADVAASANWCGMAWRAQPKKPKRFAHAVLSLRRGTPHGCAPNVRERALVDTDQLLVTQAVNRHPDDEFATRITALRACRKPAGAWLPLARRLSDWYGGDALSFPATAGTRIAMARESSYKGSDPQCSMTLVDVGLRELNSTTIATVPTTGSSSACPSRAALTETGRIAWIVLGDQLNARAANGETVALATGAWNTLTDLAISPDGLTVTWREGDVERSAPMP